MRLSWHWSKLIGIVHAWMLEEDLNRWSFIKLSILWSINHNIDSDIYVYYVDIKTLMFSETIKDDLVKGSNFHWKMHQLLLVHHAIYPLFFSRTFEWLSKLHRIHCQSCDVESICKFQCGIHWLSKPNANSALNLKPLENNYACSMHWYTK